VSDALAPLATVFAFAAVALLYQNTVQKRRWVLAIGLLCLAAAGALAITAWVTP
jgi:hypothetical protein